VRAIGIGISAALASAAATVAPAQPPGLDLVVYREPKVWGLAADGSAIVAFTIRANGRVADVLTLSATERKLADAAVEAIKGWRFARDATLGTGRNATPNVVLRREIVELVFKRDAGVTSMNHLEGAKAWFPNEHKLAVQTLVPDQLDAPLVRTPTPPSPEAVRRVSALTVGGHATLSFVVDETGTVRVPAVVAAEDPSLGAAALALVESWRYEPPIAGGKPALVEQRSTFTFPPRPAQPVLEHDRSIDR